MNTYIKTKTTISFREDMIDLIVQRRKTVTIRPMKPQPDYGSIYDNLCEEIGCIQCPYGKKGDVITIEERPEIKLRILYSCFFSLHNIPAPIWELDGLTEQDAKDKRIIIRRWQSFYGGSEYKWSRNPWVWEIKFEVVSGKEEDNA